MSDFAWHVVDDRSEAAAAGPRRSGGGNSGSKPICANSSCRYVYLAALYRSIRKSNFAATGGSGGQHPAAPARDDCTQASIPELHVDRLTSFCTEKESWMSERFYRPAGTTCITGRGWCVFKKSKKKEALFELRWLDSQFQSKVESVSLAIV